MLGRTSNPALNDQVFNRLSGTAIGETMTLSGTINKIATLLFLTILASAYSWHKFTENYSTAMTFAIGGAIVGFILALVTIFKKEWAPYTTPAYALAEGLFLGSISAMYNQQFNGIVLQAVGLTFGTLLMLLFLYKSGIIKATENFKMGVFAATGAIALLYLASFILGFFNIPIGFIHSSGTFGIIFSVIVVVVAALNLVLDFDFIENGAKSNAPKYMEWYAAFGLMVTLIWLYLEMLRLLAKLNRR